MKMWNVECGMEENAECGMRKIIPAIPDSFSIQSIFDIPHSAFRIPHFFP